MSFPGGFNGPIPWPVAPTTVGFVPDRNVLSMMDCTVAVFKDMNADGTGLVQEGVPVPDFQPVAGLESVPAHHSKESLQTQTAGGEAFTEQMERWIFASPIVLDSTNVIVWTDPDRPGVTWYFMVDGESYAPGGKVINFGKPLYWTVLSKRGTQVSPM